MRMMQVISDYIRRSILTTQGDLVVRGAAIPERLPAGAADTFLKGQGIGVIPAYEAAPVMPAMRAWRTPNQAILKNVWTKILFNRTYFDTTNDFDTVNNKWVCSQDGIYIVCLNVRIRYVANAKYFWIRAYLNGSMIACDECLTSGSGAQLTMCSTAVLQLSVNDYIEGYAKHNDAADQIIDGIYPPFTYLAIARIS